MKNWLIAGAVVALMAQAAQVPQPREWIDSDTGHRVVRLTDDAGGSTLYFHDNAFSPEGDKLMFNTPNGIAVIDCQMPTRHLESLGSRAIARSQFQSLLREHIEVAPRPLVR